MMTFRKQLYSPAWGAWEALDDDIQDAVVFAAWREKCISQAYIRKVHVPGPAIPNAQLGVNDLTQY